MGAGQLVAAPLHPADVWGHWQHTDMQHHLVFKTELYYSGQFFQHIFKHILFIKFVLQSFWLVIV
jgi:hypothetical protein